MTQPISYWLGGLLLAAASLDMAVFGTEHLLFLAQKFHGLLHWVAFWH